MPQADVPGSAGAADGDDLLRLLSPIFDEQGSMDSTSRQIVSAAYRCFVDEGFEASTMVRIAEVADVGVATVYRRFGTKQNLVRSAILKEAKRVVEIILEIGVHATSPIEGIVETFGALVNEATAPKLLTKSIRESSAVGELSGFLTDEAVIAAARGVVSAYLSRWQREGQILELDPDIVGEIFARLISSLVLTPKSVFPMGNVEDAKEFARKYFGPLLHPVAIQ